MLINDSRCPLFYYVEQINELDLTNLLTREMNEAFEALLIEYNQKYELLNEIKAHPEPLNEQELAILRSISATLENMLNDKIMQEAGNDFKTLNNSLQEQQFMATRWNLFKQHSCQYKNVVEELTARPGFV